MKLNSKFPFPRTSRFQHKIAYSTVNNTRTRAHFLRIAEPNNQTHAPPKQPT